MIDQEAFESVLSERIRAFDVAEPMVSEEAGLAGSFAIAERAIVGGVVGRILEFLGEFGFGFTKEQMLALVDKAIDAAVAALVANGRPFMARALSSDQVRKIIRNMVSDAIDRMFPAIEV